MSEAASLIGTWRLKQWTATVDGRAVTPFGGATTGLLTYTEDMRMWGTLMRVDRSPVDADTLAAAAVEERAAAAAGYLNYAGTYRLEGERVIHSVEVSLYPNWIGGDQHRSIEWLPTKDGHFDLVLSATSVNRHGQEVTNRLQWRRLTPATSVL